MTAVSPSPSLVVGVDVGGTFTDLVLCDMASGDVAIHKVATTPDDPSRGVMKGITELCSANGLTPSDISYVFHGTTTATNAVLENKGARAGMITNEGFRDISHIGSISAWSTTPSSSSCPGRPARRCCAATARPWVAASCRRPAKCWSRWTAKACAAPPRN